VADDRLRDLERRAQAGDLEAQARLLRERLRAGDLTQGRLELAAYLGHEPARVALGPTAPDEPADLNALAGGLQKWGPPAVLRAVAAATRSFVDQANDTPRTRESSIRAALASLDALDRWVECPCAEHQQALQATLGPSVILSTVVQACLTIADSGSYSTLMRTVIGLLTAFQRGPQAVLQAVRADMIPWALREEPPPANTGRGE
jgi:hypothetical protein